MADPEEKASSTSEFKQNLNEVLELLNEGNLPILVAGDGQLDSVLQGAGSHQQIVDMLKSQPAAEVNPQYPGEFKAGGKLSVDEAIRAVVEGRRRE